MSSQYTMMDKNQIRKEMLVLRTAKDPQMLERLSSQITRHVEELPEYQKCQTLLVYAPCRNEVNTLTLIRQALSQNIAVGLPKVTGPGTMKFFRIYSLSELLPGHFGVMEPEAFPERELTTGFMLMPGVAFDRSGARIGYGKGYYDYYLKHYGAAITTCALAYNFQVIDHIVTEPHDIKADYLMTEDGLIKQEGY